MTNELATMADSVTAPVQHVSFDNAVDLVDYHLGTIEQLLRAVDSSTSFLAQEIAWIFMWVLVMNILSSMFMRR
jgi:hypothetical protein